MASLNSLIKKSKYKKIPPKQKLSSPPVASILDEGSYSEKDSIKANSPTPIKREIKTGNERVTNGQQTGNKVGTQLGTELGTNWEQTGNKVGTNYSFSELSGVQKHITFFIFDQCKNNGNLVTDKLSVQFISENLNCTVGTIKTTIKRIAKKGLIFKDSFKNGRGGWTKYGIKKETYNEILNLETRNKLGTNWEQSRYTTGNKVGTQLGTPPLSSSSSSINTNKEDTTNNENLISPDQQNIFELPKEWMDINFDRLKDFGFGMPQLKQLYKLDTYSAEDIQSYIEMLDFDIINNDKTFRTGLSNGFMGILRKGDGYTAPKGYESPMDELLREEIEKKKAHLEKIKKMEEELFIISYETWIIEIPVEELEKVDGNVAGMPKFAKEGILKAYFKNNIFKRENHGG